MAKPTTKTAPAPPKEEKKEVATRPANNIINAAGSIPAALMERMQKEAGRGLSSASEDNIVPLVYILQPLSPQVNLKNPKYITGAMAGDIWLRNSSSPIVKGDEGFIFQHCYFMKDFIEWVPRTAGGGFVAKHEKMPADAKEVADPKNPQRVRYVRPNGNEIIHTRYHIGYVHMGERRLPYVIPFSSTGHTVSRGWMFTMNSKRLPSGEEAPGYSSLFKLVTRERSNVSGTWSVFDPIDMGFVQTVEDFELGSKLCDSFTRGEKTVEVPDDEGGAGQSEAQTATNENARM